MIWYHGTSTKRAKEIYKCGYFREGTWFARHLEDAIEFGGPYVFAVEIKFKSRKWQVCCLNKIPAGRIKKIYQVKTKIEALRGEGVEENDY